MCHGGVQDPSENKKKRTDIPEQLWRKPTITQKMKNCSDKYAKTDSKQDTKTSKELSKMQNQ